jgi:adenine/guanine phosphoribosyltransferase-like PRPP-binding protein
MSFLQPHFAESTLNYWQDILHSSDPIVSNAQQLPYRHRYPAVLPNDQVLFLPIRQLYTNPNHAVASLLVNQASFSVVEQLAAFLCQTLGQHLDSLDSAVDMIIGLPTLGNTLAPFIAKYLGFSMLPLCLAVLSIS